jgi:hypothetical protein
MLTGHEDLVWSIANELRPWKHSESHVFLEICNTIESMRCGLAKTPEIGFRNENKQRAKRIVDALNVVERAITSPSFIASLLASSEEFESAQLVLTDTAEWELEDLDRLWIKQKKEVSQELAEFSKRATKLVKQCEKMITNPPGSDPRFGHQQHDVACGALFLWLELSRERPTAGTYNSKFCTVASLLWEAITGERERNLERACKRLLSWLALA